jgi:hypothetical protein
MRKLPVRFVLVFCHLCISAAAADTPLLLAQKLFDAMKSHDADAAARLFVPGANLSSVDAAGKASITPFEKFVEAIRTSKNNWLERIWKPTVLENDTVAVVWAEYDFHLNGSLHHCGMDSFQMLKTADGWKIAAISDTRQTSGCKPSPLGAPPA